MPRLYDGRQAVTAVKIVDFAVGSVSAERFFRRLIPYGKRTSLGIALLPTLYAYGVNRKRVLVAVGGSGNK